MRKQARIALINSSWPPVNCGVGDYGHRLAGALSQLGCRIEVFTSAEFPIEPYRTSNLHVRPVVSRWNRLNLLQILPALWRFSPQYVLFQYPTVIPAQDASLTYWGPILLRLIMPWTKPVFIVHEYSRTLDINKRGLLRAFKFCFRVLAFDSVDLQEMTQAGVDARIIPIGPNIPPANPVPPANSDFIFFGLQEERKGLGVLLEALAQVPQAHLKLVGKTNPQFQGIAQELGVDDRVTWLGRIDDPGEVAALLAGARAAVFPYFDGMRPNSGSVLAAIVNGTPVITTAGPSTPNDLRDNAAVTFVEPENIGALVKAIRNHLAGDFRLSHHKELAELARRYDWQEIGREFLRAIH